MLRVIQRPSPNFDERVGVDGPDILIMHYTGMQSCEAAVRRLTDPAARVSSHYTVDEDGTVYVHVDEAKRAWHAGVSFWRGETDINSHSVGIEIVNPGHEFGYRAFPDAQIEAVIELSKGILSRHRIPARNVIAHSDIAPGRKEDPGELFPWSRFAGQGIGVWVEAAHVSGDSLAQGAQGEAVAALQHDLSRYGYGIDASGAFDEHTKAVVIAFQRHFRPAKFDGVVDAETLDLLGRLLAVVEAAA
ncbi:MAG: N-acetylmuramoyl-L-alanine amidase [Micropepsaceae bacterium]